MCVRRRCRSRLRLRRSPRPCPPASLPVLLPSALVLVSPADPELPILITLVAPFRRVVEDRVVRHEELQSAPRGRVRVVDLVALPDERAEPRALGEVAGDVGARRAGVLLDDRRERPLQLP